MASLRSVGFAAVLALSQSAAAQQIRLWPSASVSDSIVRLRDVAEIRTADANAATCLGGIEIPTPADAAGEFLIELSDVREALRRSGVNMAYIELSGSIRCTVLGLTPRRDVVPSPSKPLSDTPAPAANAIPSARPATRRPLGAKPEDTLEQAVREYLTGRFPGDAGRLSIRFSPASAEALRIGGRDIRFDVRSRDADALGLVALDVDVIRTNAPTQRVALTAEVALAKSVVVARRALNHGATVRPGDVALEERTFVRRGDLGLTDLAAVVGKEVRTFVRAGEQVRPRDLGDAPLVRRGDLVTIWSRRGNLAIKSAGRAAAAGGPGDTIGVKCEGIQELIAATVTGPKTVTVGGSMQVAAK